MEENNVVELEDGFRERFVANKRNPFLREI